MEGASVRLVVACACAAVCAGVVVQTSVPYAYPESPCWFGDHCEDPNDTPSANGHPLSKPSLYLPESQEGCAMKDDADDEEMAVPVAKNFGIIFDIDGVVARGRNVLQAARDAFTHHLTDGRGHFRVPVVFVTNAGNCMRYEKARKLQDWLHLKIPEEQVVLSHSPMRMLSEFHNKRVLVSGQGPLIDIAHSLGFTNVTTMEEMRCRFPMLDMVDHKRRKLPPCGFESYFPSIEAVVLLGEPVRWETNLQLIIDVLMTNGQPSKAPEAGVPYPHIPVLASNMDLLWMAEAPLPRFGHGAFLVALEALYKKMTGKEMQYSALLGKPSELTYIYAENVLQKQAKRLTGSPRLERVYMVGDNVETDIVGANLYDTYLAKRRAIRKDAAAAAAPAPESFHTRLCPSIETAEIDEFFPDSCESILVQTGVYEGGANWTDRPADDPINYAHRDVLIRPPVRRPRVIVPDILDAVKHVFGKEDFK